MASGARSEKLDLRLTPAAKVMLREAASASQQSVSEFVLQSALSRAEEALADRQRFGLTAARFAQFMKALDAPVRSMPRARRLLTKPSVFDRK